MHLDAPIIRPLLYPLHLADRALEQTSVPSCGVLLDLQPFTHRWMHRQRPYVPTVVPCRLTSLHVDTASSSSKSDC